jgi:tetratricopeptide (TPR) repeat protein
MTWTRCLFAICLLGSNLLAQGPRQRDLKYEPDEPREVKAGPKALTIPRSYALVIGVAKYPKLEANGQLEFSERDAELMYSILISPEGGQFRAEHVHRLIGAKATLENIRYELEEWLPKVAKEDDRVVIYFAGHGFVHGGRGYLAPVDIDPKNVAGTGYPMDSLGQVIGSKIKAKWKVLLTDSCHSGNITPAEDAAKLNSKLQTLERSIFSLTASRDREQSFESKEWGGGHGIFTYYVSKGLEGAADEDRNGIVNADELAEYVRREVRAATGGRQNPTSDRGSFDSNMLLAYIPTSAKPGNPPPPKTGTLIFEANMDGVEVFVDGKSVGTVSKGGALRLPGLVPGPHSVKGVKMGYEPDGPREEIVYPGQESTITLKILVARRRTKAALDAFEKGLDEYNKGSAEHYKKAVTYFQSALAADKNYSQAALFLGRTYNALFEQEEARKYFARAIEIDPDYLEARATFGGMLLDRGELDESIRQLDVVTRRDKQNALAWCLLAQAYRRKDLYRESIEAARESIRLNPSNGEAHLWLAESLRMNGQHKDAVREYNAYLTLSDFDSKLAGKLNYWVMGFITGTGKKKRANLKDIWGELRSLTHFGICDSQRKLQNLDGAIASCQQALVYDSKDPYAHYVLGLTYMHKARETGRVDYLPAARKHFESAIEINPDLDEMANARKNLTAIASFLASN